MRRDKFVDCVTIDIDCVPSKYPYPECGNPKYEGFMFRVDARKYEKLLKYTLTTLNTYNVPIIYVRCYKGKTSKDFLYDKIDIYSTILSQVQYMLNRQAEVEEEQEMHR